LANSRLHRRFNLLPFLQVALEVCSGGSCREFAVQLHERTVGKLLRKLSFRRLSVRPQHPQTKPEEQAVFRAALPIS